MELSIVIILGSHRTIHNGCLMWFQEAAPLEGGEDYTDVGDEEVWVSVSRSTGHLTPQVHNTTLTA